MIIIKPVRRKRRLDDILGEILAFESDLERDFKNTAAAIGSPNFVYHLQKTHANCFSLLDLVNTKFHRPADLPPSAKKENLLPLCDWTVLLLERVIDTCKKRKDSQVPWSLEPGVERLKAIRANISVI
ncbi:MAG: hypothetical protein WC764_01825 [Candidatus Paceibacterota bacterium]|jgi:hypothetical protein